MTEHGCHDCAHHAAPQVCAAPMPRRGWLQYGGRWGEGLCPAHKPSGETTPLREAARRYDSAYWSTRHAARYWPLDLRKEAANRSAQGSIAHPDDDRSQLDLPGEALQEAEDVAGYGGLARLTGRWSWRWAVAVLLAGWIARLMQAERGRGK